MFFIFEVQNAPLLPTEIFLILLGEFIVILLAAFRFDFIPSLPSDGFGSGRLWFGGRHAAALGGESRRRESLGGMDL